MASGHFKIGPQLIRLLGTQYQSTEEAIKELVANSWDADATLVWITLPEPLKPDPIIVRDDGYGMTENEINAYFLDVADDRRRTRGVRTPKGRDVRGNRGIGKFAGLMAAQMMTVTTISRGNQCRFVLDRKYLEEQGRELTEAEIIIASEPSDESPGTTIELSNLSQTFTHPAESKLGRILLREFGRQDNFAIHINGHLLTPNVLEGDVKPLELVSSDGTLMHGHFMFLERQRMVADPGIIIRVNGRAIGPPTYFGLENDPEVPKSFLNRVYGEITADALVDEVTANWGTFIENGAGYQRLTEAGRDWLRHELTQQRESEGGGSAEQFVEDFSEKIEKLPLSRRDRARKALFRVFQRFYDEARERKHAIAELVLNAFEEDDYWVLVKKIDETSDDDISRLADILQLWGLREISGIVDHARQRLRLLDAFDRLIMDETTKELTGVHSVLQLNTWLFGDQYSLMTSNKQLRTVVEKLFEPSLQRRKGRATAGSHLGLASQHLPYRRTQDDRAMKSNERMSHRQRHTGMS